MPERILIFIAEDYEPLLYAMCGILGEDYEVVGVRDGRALLDAVEQRCPEIALLDISMRVLGGLAAARKLRQTHPGLKLMFVSAHSDSEDVTEAFRLGARGYLLKRALATQLAGAVQQVLAGHRFLSPGLKLGIA